VREPKLLEFFPRTLNRYGSSRKSPRGNVVAEGVSIGPVHHASSIDWRCATALPSEHKDEGAAFVSARAIAWASTTVTTTVVMDFLVTSLDRYGAQMTNVAGSP
jgi:hypothetical protein